MNDDASQRLHTIVSSCKIEYISSSPVFSASGIFF